MPPKNKNVVQRKGLFVSVKSYNPNQPRFLTPKPVHPTTGPRGNLDKDPQCSISTNNNNNNKDNKYNGYSSGEEMEDTLRVPDALGGHEGWIPPPQQPGEKMPDVLEGDGFSIDFRKPLPETFALEGSPFDVNYLTKLLEKESDASAKNTTDEFADAHIDEALKLMFPVMAHIILDEGRLAEIRQDELRKLAEYGIVETKPGFDIGDGSTGPNGRLTEQQQHCIVSHGGTANGEVYNPYPEIAIDPAILLQDTRFYNANGIRTGNIMTQPGNIVVQQQHQRPNDNTANGSNAVGAVTANGSNTVGAVRQPQQQQQQQQQQIFRVGQAGGASLATGGPVQKTKGLQEVERLHQQWTARYDPAGRMSGNGLGVPPRPQLASNGNIVFTSGGPPPQQKHQQPQNSPMMGNGNRTSVPLQRNAVLPTPQLETGSRVDARQKPLLRNLTQGEQARMIQNSRTHHQDAVASEMQRNGNAPAFPGFRPYPHLTASEPQADLAPKMGQPGFISGLKWDSNVNVSERDMQAIVANMRNARERITPKLVRDTINELVEAADDPTMDMEHLQALLNEKDLPPSFFAAGKDFCVQDATARCDINEENKGRLTRVETKEVKRIFDETRAEEIKEEKKEDEMFLPWHNRDPRTWPLGWDHAADAAQPSATTNATNKSGKNLRSTTRRRTIGEYYDGDREDDHQSPVAKRPRSKPDNRPSIEVVMVSGRKYNRQGNGFVWWYGVRFGFNGEEEATPSQWTREKEIMRRCGSQAKKMLDGFDSLYPRTKEMGIQQQGKEYRGVEGFKSAGNDVEMGNTGDHGDHSMRSNNI